MFRDTVTGRPVGSEPAFRRGVPASNPFSDKPTLDEIQRRYITFVIESTNGKISGPGGATDILGMKRSSLYSRMKTLGMNNK
jgi:DNA-binding NtrC family response regulator